MAALLEQEGGLSPHQRRVPAALQQCCLLDLLLLGQTVTLCRAVQRRQPGLRARAARQSASSSRTVR